MIIGLKPKARLLSVQRAIRAGANPPLENLIRIAREYFDGSHYAQAWSMIYWLVHSNKNNQDIFNRFYAKASRGPTKPEDFEAAIGVPMQQFERHWKEWVSGLDPDE